jgi:hypothetical protein
VRIDDAEEEFESELCSLVYELSETIDDAADRLERAIYRYKEGWEDDALDIIMGLMASLRQTVEYAEWLTCGKWVDFGDAEIEAEL